MRGTVMGLIVLVLVISLFEAWTKDSICTQGIPQDYYPPMAQ